MLITRRSLLVTGAGVTTAMALPVSQVFGATQEIRVIEHGLGFDPSAHPTLMLDRDYDAFMTRLTALWRHQPLPTVGQTSAYAFNLLSQIARDHGFRSGGTQTIFTADGGSALNWRLVPRPSTFNM